MFVLLGPIWQKVFSHDTAGGLFANLEEGKQKNTDNEDAALFSILYNLESMRNDEGMFHFKLCYPERTEYQFPCNEWIQSSIHSFIHSFIVKKKSVLDYQRLTFNV